MEEIKGKETYVLSPSVWGQNQLAPKIQNGSIYPLKFENSFSLPLKI